MRHPLLPVPRAYHVGPDLGLAGELRVRRGGRLRRPRGIPGLPGQPGAPADHREAPPADSGPARRGPVRVLTRTHPRQVFYYPRVPVPVRTADRSRRGNARTPAWRPGGRTWLERCLDGKRQHSVAEIAEAAGVHRNRPRNHRWAVPGIVPPHAFHDGRTEPIPVRQPTWPGARTAFPSGRAGAMTYGRPVKTACGVVSLRRHCPDQVPGGRRSAS